MKYSLLISFFVLILNPSEQAGTKSQLGDQIVIDGKNHTIPDAVDVKTVVPPEPTAPTSTTPSSTTTNTSNTTTPAPTSTVTPTNVTTITPSNVTTIAPSNVTTIAPSNITTATTPMTKPTTISTTPSTPTSSSSTTTVNPPVPTTAKPAEPERRFDGPSFVGGIVLALGLVAIGFVAFKFYKARTELNYHTL